MSPLYLSTGHANGHGGSAGPMGEATDNSLTFLMPGDIHALVVYLRSIPAQDSDLPRTVETPAPASYREGAGGRHRSARREDLRQRLRQLPRLDRRKPGTSKYATLTGVRAVNDPSCHQCGADGDQWRQPQDRPGQDLHAGLRRGLFRRRHRGGGELRHRPLRRQRRASDRQGHRLSAQAGGATT